MGEPWDTIRREWAVIAQAPWSFFSILVICSAAVWAAVWLLFRREVESLNAIIRRHEATAPPHSPVAPVDDGKQAARRKLIADGRRLIAEFNQQVRQPTLMGFLQYREEWPAIRAQLDPNVRRDLENNRTFVVTKGPEKDGKVYRLMDELARLEKEWDLS